MSSRGQRREEAKREEKSGDRLANGSLPAGPGGRPLAEIRCFHCDRLLLRIPPSTPRWMLRGSEIRCSKCKRITVL